MCTFCLKSFLQNSVHCGSVKIPSQFQANTHHKCQPTQSALFQPPLFRSRWESFPATQGHCISAHGRVSPCYMYVVTFSRPHSPHRLCANSVMSCFSCLLFPWEYYMELYSGSGFNPGLILALFTHLRVPSLFQQGSLFHHLLLQSSVLEFLPTLPFSGGSRLSCWIGFLPIPQ